MPAADGTAVDEYLRTGSVVAVGLSAVGPWAGSVFCPGRNFVVVDGFDVVNGL